VLGKRRGKLESPIKLKSLRDPGQSLDAQIQDIVYERVMFWTVAMVLVLVLAAQEWYRWYAKTPPAPIPISIVAIATLLIGAFRLSAYIRQLKRLALGRDGERAVGQELDKLRAKGFEVIHDIPGEGFNIDHVVIGRRGIYTVETKTIRFPEGSRPELKCSDEKVFLNGRPMDRNPIPQAKAQSAWLRSFLEESTGKTFLVQPVVVFPGWFVSPECNNHSGVWVLNPLALPKFVEHEPERLTQEDARLAAYHLRLYVRARK
jgi:hypothetical protein